MMDYETATNFEINKAVAEALGFELGWQSGDKIGIADGSACGRYFDPCNSWADAGPIIVENDIEVKPNKKGFDYAQTFVLVQNGRCHAIFSHHCHGVLRAAMIVFLKMKEAE